MWFAKRRLNGFHALRKEFAIVWAAAHGSRWAVPVLVVLGLGSSVAETLGISLVILFLYAVIGGVAKTGASEGLLSRIFHYGELLSGGNRLLLALLIFLLIFGKAAFNLAYSLLTTIIKNTVSERTRNAVYRNYLAIPYGDLRSRDQGALLTTLATESWAVADAFYAFTRLGTNVCAIAVFSTFLISIAWPIFLVGGIGILALFGISRRIAKPARKLGSETMASMRALTLHMMNTLQSMRAIRAFAIEGHMRSLFEGFSARVRRVLVRMDHMYSLTAPVNDVGYFLLLGGIAWTATRFNISAAATLGAVALLYRLQPHLREFEGNRIKLMGLGPTLDAVDAVLKLHAGPAATGGVLPFRGLSNAIAFKSVSFAYPEAAEPALSRVSFSIPRGSRTVICGASGAGKTTIVNLLLGLYRPSEGEVLIDGTSLARLNLPDWLKDVALAGQDAELIEGTVRDNIVIARPDASDTDIAWAVEKAGLSDAIRRLPSGYDTWIGERGLNVSGGQRQRIALARAFLRKPALLILDEATNAVDVPLAADIQRNILEIMREGTVIHITHHPDEALGIDHCIRLDAGGVAYEGASASVGRPHLVASAQSLSA